MAQEGSEQMAGTSSGQVPSVPGNPPTATMEVDQVGQASGGNAEGLKEGLAHNINAAEPGATPRKKLMNRRFLLRFVGWKRCAVCKRRGRHGEYLLAEELLRASC